MPAAMHGICMAPVMRSTTTAQLFLTTVVFPCLTRAEPSTEVMVPMPMLVALERPSVLPSGRMSSSRKRWKYCSG